jgi:uncharacterized protein YqeY
MSALKQTITDDMKSAMRAKDKNALKAVRMILGAIKQKEIDERIELDGVQILAVIQKMVKQRKDSITQFESANRLDLVAIEVSELDIINRYMPTQLSESEVSLAVDKAIADINASSMQDMGKLMGLLKPQLDGKADMGAVSALIRAKLA